MAKSSPVKVSVECPHCGFKQHEYAAAKSTMCRQCGAHFAPAPPRPPSTVTTRARPEPRTEAPSAAEDLAVIELTRPDPADAHQRQIVATLRVHSDRTWTITGDASRVPTQIAVYDAVSGRWVRLTEDPVTWALNLNTELRTGYLTARTIHPNTSP